MTAGEVDRDRAHRKRRVDDLYRRAPVSLFGMAVALGVIATLVIPRGGAGVHAVLWALAGLVAVRLALVLADLGGHPPSTSDAAREAMFVAGAALTGVALGALNVAAYPTLTPAECALLGACETGAIAAGLASLGASAVGFALYAVPNLGTLILMVALDQRAWGERTFLALLLLYLPAVLLISVQQSRLRRHAVELELELGLQAVRDPLTGLFNRRFFDELLDKEAAVAESSCQMRDRRKPARATVVGLLMVDVDHFKRVNDTHGHAVGDAVLRQMAALLRGCLRRSDEAVRWGGEEFVVILRVPWEDRANVVVVARRILNAVRSHTFTGGGEGLRLTASVGFATHPLSNEHPSMIPWTSTMRLVDEALYLAKAEGRDRAVGVEAGPALGAAAAGAAPTLESGLRAGEAAGLLRTVRDDPAGEPRPAEAPAQPSPAGP